MVGQNTTKRKPRTTLDALNQNIHEVRQLRNSITTGILIPGISTAANQTTQISQGATMIGLLNTIIANQVANQDIEYLLVRDLGNGGLVVRQILEYDQTTGTWNIRYEDVNGANYIPVGPIEYQDSSAIMASILAELQSIDVNTSTNATEATLLNVLTELQGTLDVNVTNQLTGLATEVTLAALNAKFNTLGQKASAASHPMVLSTEQEAILQAVSDVLTNDVFPVLTDIENNTGDVSNKINTRGQKASADSTPVVLSTEQEAILSGITTAIGDVATETTLAALNAKLNSLGQKTSAASAPVVLSSEQENILSAIRSNTDATAVALGDVATETTLTALNGKLNTLGQKASSSSAPVVLSTEQEVILSSLATESTLSNLNSKFNTLGQKNSAGSHPVVLSSEQQDQLQKIVDQTDKLEANTETTFTEIQQLQTDLAARISPLGQRDSADSTSVVLSNQQEVFLSNISRKIDGIANRDTNTGVATANTLRVVQEDLVRDHTVQANWEFVAGNSKEMTYYPTSVPGTDPNNPSGNENLQTVVFKQGVSTIITQTFTYDTSDRIVTLVTT